MLKLQFCNKSQLPQLAAAVFFALSLTACAIVPSPSVSGTYRYKMTVEVETPEGIKTGSAVREVHTNTYLLPQHHSDYPQVKGGAVVVDLGKRGVLFGLLQSPIAGVDYAYSVVYRAFPPPKGTAPLTIAGTSYYAKLHTTPAVLEPINYPTFIKFGKLDQPSTAEDIYMKAAKDGSHTEENINRALGISFGSGVRIKAVTVEINPNEPVSCNVEKWLPWLVGYYNKMLDGQRFNTLNSHYPIANSLSAGSFRAN